MKTLGLIGSVIASLGIWIVIIHFLTGCSNQSGWRFSIGVAPVAAINEVQSTADKRK